MLELAKVIKKNTDTGRFDTVFFFDKDRENVVETNKRIPGAIGFPGEFVNIVLADDQGDIDRILDAPQDIEESAEAKRRQLLIATKRDFVKSFPFDVINLDLEQFFFKPSDPFPGKLVNTMRKLFEWQRNPFFVGTRKKKARTIDSFSLMFTTRVGPSNLSDEYLEMLRDCVTANLVEFPDLLDCLETRTGTSDIETLERDNFPAFFKLSVPKLIARILADEDWYVDEGTGIDIYEFDRQSNSGPYQMLHLVMDVVRKNPPLDQRAPGQDAPAARAAYINVVKKIFDTPEVVVSKNTIDTKSLKDDLDKIKLHRRKYYPEE